MNHTQISFTEPLNYTLGRLGPNQNKQPQPESNFVHHDDFLMTSSTFQIKESDEMIRKMESTHSKLNEAFESAKSKSDKSSEDYIKSKAEANEFKSLLSFKEIQVNLINHFKRLFVKVGPLSRS